MKAFAGLALAAALSMPGPASAADDPVGGTWKVTGKIETFAFTLTCRFDRHGDTFGGVCLDGGSGRRHVIDTGRIDGDRVSWTYPFSFLLTQHEVAYNGRLVDGRLQGNARAYGYNGVFTGERP